MVFLICCNSKGYRKEHISHPLTNRNRFLYSFAIYTLLLRERWKLNQLDFSWCNGNWNDFKCKFLIVLNYKYILKIIYVLRYINRNRTGNRKCSYWLQFYILSRRKFYKTRRAFISRCEIIYLIYVCEIKYFADDYTLQLNK